MKITGLTGGIASGKSTVSAIFNRQGGTIIDADLVAREVVQPDRWAWRRIVAHFGTDILEADRQIDRKRLGSIVFENPSERRFLNRATHPPIIGTVMRNLGIQLFRRPPLVVLDAALLYEAAFLRWLAGRVIVVYVDRETQLKRLMARDSLPEKDALLRIDAQMPLEEKRDRADDVIDNTGTRENTEAQVLALWNRLV